MQVASPMSRLLLQIKSIVFYLGFATLLTHELDAMPNHEWRLFPVLRSLSDELGMTVFILLHIPIYAGLIALVASTNPRIRGQSRLAISGFLVIHALLHRLFMGRTEYEFTSALSAWLIIGGALLGAVYLALAINEFNTRIRHTN